MKLLRKIPLDITLILCLTLGLAPFSPPHLYEKVRMIITGSKLAVVDWFDLLLHGFPWILLLSKLLAAYLDKKNS